MKLFLLCLIALCATAFASPGSKVADLSADNFDEHIKSNTQTLVEFFAPWCGHCKNLAPEYDAASVALEGKNAGTLAKVDCTIEKDLCSRFNVRGFPTLKLFRNDGSQPTDYDSARKADAIVKYMVKQSSPAVAALESADSVRNFAKDDKVKVVGFFGNDYKLDEFNALAGRLRNDFSFGAVIGRPEIDKEFSVTAPAIILFRKFDEGDLVYKGDLNKDQTSEALYEFIKINSFPLVGEIGPENYAKYIDRGFNLVWIFIDMNNADHAKMIEDVVTAVARNHHDKLSFVKIDGIRWAEHAKGLGLSGETPGIVIEDRENRKNFVYPQEKTIAIDDLNAHVTAFLNGELKPIIRSEPIPETNDGPVKVLVGKTFDSIVMDTTKDVLVEFYAPWCGHCKHLTPIYEQLGERFASDPNVVIAKIDATVNDSPADIQGFPTLIFYPAGDKSNPVDYEGDRTAKDMAAFIRKHGTVVNKDVKDEEDDHDHDHAHDHDHDHDHGHDDL